MAVAVNTGFLTIFLKLGGSEGQIGGCLRILFKRSLGCCKKDTWLIELQGSSYEKLHGNQRLSGPCPPGVIHRFIKEIAVPPSVARSGAPRASPWSQMTIPDYANRC